MTDVLDFKIKQRSELRSLGADAGRILPMPRYAVYTFPWGSAIREIPSEKWLKVVVAPLAQVIDVSDLNVVLHNNGIEFLK